MNKENINSNPITMVLLPQTEWQETIKKIDQLLAVISTKQEGNENTLKQQERIPLIQFKKDRALQLRYGLTYTTVRKLVEKKLLCSYNDPEYTRYKWTTHRDIMNYLDSIKNKGIKL